jgi:hypothetical protein
VPTKSTPVIHPSQAYSKLPKSPSRKHVSQEDPVLNHENDLFPVFSELPGTANVSARIHTRRRQLNIIIYSLDLKNPRLLQEHLQFLGSFAICR